MPPFILDNLKELELAVATGQASEDQLRKMPPADVRAIKRGVPFQVRATAAGIVKADGDGSADSRQIRYVASTEHADRMGDIIRVYGGKGADNGSGWQLKTIKQNPVALWSHESWMPPIGKLLDVKRVKSHPHADGTTGPALLATIDYFDADLSEVADTAWKMAKRGVLRAVSVGFLPLKDTSGNMTPEDAEEMGLGRWGVEFTEQDLLELSQAVVPANPFALQTSIKAMVESGEISERDAKAFAKLYPLTEKDLIERLRERVRSVVDMGREGDGVGDVLERTTLAIEPESATGALPSDGLGSILDRAVLPEPAEGATLADEVADDSAEADADEADAGAGIDAESRTFLRSVLEPAFDALEDAAQHIGRALDTLETSEGARSASRARERVQADAGLQAVAALTGATAGLTQLVRELHTHRDPGSAQAPIARTVEPEGDGDDTETPKPASATAAILDGAADMVARVSGEVKRCTTGND